MESIDTATAARFLAALTGDTLHTFQTFDDAGKGRPGLTRILHGTFAKHANRLASLNERGAGIFVMVNRGDGMGRKAVNVTACRALFVDLDGAPIEPVLAAPIPPRIVVESSPGKWHAYWPVVDLPLEQFSGAQKTLANLYGGDAKVCDRPRVMRLPGFLHRKASPFLTRLERCESAPLTWQEMNDAFGLSQRLTLPAHIPEGQRNDTLYRLARASATKGIPEQEQVKRALQVNAKRCQPPLCEAEVRAVVASAYSAPRLGGFTVPFALPDSAAFKAVSNGARLLALLAYRKLDGFNNGRIALAHSEFRELWPRKSTFLDHRKELVTAGLLEIAQPAGKPAEGKAPTAGLYRLPIGTESAPYPSNALGAKSVTLEAFQALAVGAPESPSDVSGRKSAAETVTEPSGFHR